MRRALTLMYAEPISSTSRRSTSSGSASPRRACASSSDPDRPHGVAGELQQPGQLERRLGSLARVGREGDRLLEVLDGARRAGARLGPAELGQQLAARRASGGGSASARVR